MPPESIEASEYTPYYVKSKIVSSLGSGAALLDYDNDAYLDLYIVNCPPTLLPSAKRDLKKLKQRGLEIAQTIQRLM